MVLENVNAQPRAFLVHQVTQVADMQHAVDAMRQPSFDTRLSAVVEGAPPVAIAPAPAESPGADKVEFVSNADERVEMRVTAASPALLVLTDTYYPGWQATVDGTEQHIYPADVAFRAIAVDAGEHTVQFEYRPVSFVLGVAAALLGLLLLAAVVVLTTRRHPAPRAIRHA
jgi:hypothetical protein